MTFDGIHFCKVPRGSVFGYGLRHSTNNEVLAEIVQRLSVEVTHGLAFLELLPNIGHQDFVAHSPKEFFKVHGVHLYTVLLGWNDNVLNVFLDRYE